MRVQDIDPADDGDQLRLLAPARATEVVIGDDGS
jgi:hypothetical protein